MKIKFQADADLNIYIVNAVLRIESKIDFKTANDAKLEGLDDHKVLQFAANQQRILVSHDQRTMPSHFAKFITNYQSYGVLIIPKRLPTLEVAENIVLIWETFIDEEWINRIAFLPI